MNYRFTQRLKSFLLVSLTLMCLPALGQYKWIGPDGKVTYSDQPPPSGAKPVATQSAPIGNVSANSGLPYELNRTAQNYPVTLYTMKECAPCDSGRELLKKRGIPYTEKTIETFNDNEALKKLMGQTSLPVLMVGPQRKNNYQPDEWEQALDLAGYPKTSQLPRNYQAPVSSLAPSNNTPAPASPKPAAPASNEVSTEPPPKPSNAPPGFRF